MNFNNACNILNLSNIESFNYKELKKNYYLSLLYKRYYSNFPLGNTYPPVSKLKSPLSTILIAFPIPIVSASLMAALVLAFFISLNFSSVVPLAKPILPPSAKFSAANAGANCSKVKIFC